jgi:hypothetical protein
MPIFALYSVWPVRRIHIDTGNVVLYEETDITRDTTRHIAW